MCVCVCVCVHGVGGGGVGATSVTAAAGFGQLWYVDWEGGTINSIVRMVFRQYISVVYIAQQSRIKAEHSDLCCDTVL